MSRMLKVYVAGPYSSDPTHNTQTAIDAGEELYELGFAPFVPHLFHFWQALHEHTWEEWLLLGMEWMRDCDAVLRLPGESTGATIEVALAHALDIPVFQDTASVKAWRNGRS